ncbi:polyketide synthase [Diplodia corticola]|uniref:Polyketide synthase n=1 Tax=Diplodia corticola TaxID=236234 RepID=A0A1J9QUN5_9PEZI|nr:polyketide synthase [Diplodia corticola]OJD32113.1 polyketide synthase [Diplodia corticola]
MTLNDETVFDSGEDTSMPIAIVGIGGRFPGDATNPERLWEMVSEGRNAMSEVPKDRFNIDSFYHPHAERQGTMNVRGGHFLKEDIALFDAPFFSITSKEAGAMDPQQRLALEVAYEGLENAGMRMEDVLGSSMACYMASFTRDYATLRGHDAQDIPLYEGTGNGAALISNRISWFFDLKGPSLSLDTACSSSLVALHLACQSLRSGEVPTALVGGTNLILMPEMQIAMTSLHFLSPDSKSQSFDHKANGYARGEGAAVVVLKPLADAIRDGNTIRAVIRGTGVNQDGKTPGITLPSAKAQEDLIRATYAQAGLDMASTAYFEAHGTGTPAGDPLECSAIAATISAARPKDKPLLVGSVKTNIGHMEGASGLAGLIKAVYAIERGVIPPNLWYEKANPRIPLEKWGLKIPTKLLPWPTKGLRRASVNSFGYGGTNAHCILDDAFHYLRSRGLRAPHNTIVDGEEADDSGISSVSRTDSDDNSSSQGWEEVSTDGGRGSQKACKAPLSHPKLLVWSSHEQVGTERAATQLIDYLQMREIHTQLNDRDEARFLERLAFTLSDGRSRLPWKAFTVASTVEELTSTVKRHQPKPLRSSQAAPVLCFVFTGQGAQWSAMGRELMVYSAFQESLEAAAGHLKTFGCSWDLLDELLADEQTSRINEPEVSQPACTALQIALVDLLVTWGIRPSVVIGHSSGEIAAAYAKGSISREAAYSIAYHRGRLSAALKKDGSMLAVGLGEEAVLPFVKKASKGDVVVACVNSPSSVTLSGDTVAISEVQDVLEAEKIFNRRLMVKTAYHSPHMQALSQAYLDALAGLKSAGGDGTTVQMVSSVNGALVDDASLATPQYWVSNMVSPVKFNQAVQTALEYSPNKRRTARKAQFVNIFLEIGPHAALQGPLKQILSGQEKKLAVVSYVSTLSRGKNAARTCLEALGKLVQHGYPVDIATANEPNEKSKSSRAFLTDLPPFAWNHGTRYWYESPVSQAFRHRTLPRYDLVGALSEHSTELEPSWSNYLRVSEAPWIEHHKVQGSILYPLSGMMVMAIEAARQIADQSKEIEGFQLRDVSVGKAMVLPADAPIETKLQFRPWRAGSRLPDSFWHEFTISCRTRQGVWTQHCGGLICVKYVTKANETFADEEAATSKKHRDEYFRLVGAGFKPDDPRQVYASLAELGLQWGPTFARLVAISSGDFEAHCALEIPDTKKYMPEGFEYPHVIHPATLDNFIQMVIPACTPAGVQLEKAKIPRFIEGLYISNKISAEPGTRYYGYSRSKPYGFNEAIGTIAASDSQWEKPMVIIEGCRIISLENMTDGMASEANTKSLRKLGAHPEWGMDIEHLPLTTARAFFGEYGKVIPDAKQKVIHDLEFASFVFCKRMLRRFTPTDAEAFAPHHRLFYEYMQHRYELAEQGKLDCQSREFDWLDTTDAFDDEVLAHVSAASIDGRVLCHQGAKLDKILLGELEPLEVLMEDNLLTEYYRNALGTDKWNPIIAKFVQVLSHKKALRILEVGAGTGGTTSVVLSALGKRADAAARLQSYMFTDISSGFFEAAAADFEEWAPFLDYKVLNVEKDPVAQGVTAGVYDLVIANNVLHATTSISACLAHCKMMLKPGGILLLGELTSTLARVPMIFGTLSGWWNGEHDGRKWGPRLSEQEWDVQLREQGFSGLDMCFRDHSTDDYSISLMLSTAAPAAIATPSQEIVVITPAELATPVVSLVRHLKAKLAKGGASVQEMIISDVDSANLAGKCCISALEADKPCLHDIGSEDFETVKRLLLGAGRTLWLTKGAAMDSPHPEGNLIAGLGRTIRAEIPSFELTTLDLDPAAPVDSEGTIAAICQIVRSSTEAGNAEKADWEYALRENTIYSLRMVPDETLNDMFEASTTESLPVPLPFGQPDRALALAIRVPGMLDTFQFVDDEEHSKPLGDHEVEIAVRAVGMNFHDVMISMGQIADTDLGVECSGVVTRAGRSVTAYAIGDRVITFRLGCFRTFLRNPEEMFQKIPDGMSFEDAASLPCIYSTVYYALFDVARLRQGETVLVHAAAGGLGQAAIILAQHLGAEIFVTVSSEAKKRFLVDTYGVAEDHVFNSRDLSFAAGIKRMTNGRGMDVVLNSLAGEALRETWLCVAPFGRFIELGKKDIVGNTGVDMSPFMNNITFAGVNMLSVYRDNVPLFGRIISDVMKCLSEGIIRPVQPVKTMKFSQIEEAFRIMQTGKHIGKMVLTAGADDIVPIVPRRLQPYNFSPDATYLIPGGLGGLGRSIAAWMVSQGARNLVFTSRSGAKKPEAQALLDVLHKHGAKTKAFACDISNASDLRQVLDCVKRQFPPIRGVVTCAMQLQDVLFENMSVVDYRAAIHPKVQATRNLHDMLPKDLDFFICLSSTGGIVGSRGQGNYNAGNTYQDAISHHRHSLGLAATSINLGVVLGVGITAERGEILSYLKTGAMIGIHEHEVLAVIQAAMAGRLPSQAVVGLATGGLLKQNGHDDPFWFAEARFNPLRVFDTQEFKAAQSDSSEELQAALAEAKTAAEATDAVCGALMAKLAKAMLMEVDDLDAARPANSYGVDSLVAVEIRAWAFKEVKSDVSVFDILSNVPLITLAERIVAKSSLVSSLVRSDREIE